MRCLKTIFPSNGNWRTASHTGSTLLRTLLPLLFGCSLPTSSTRRRFFGKFDRCCWNVLLEGCWFLGDLWQPSWDFHYNLHRMLISLWLERCCLWLVMVTQFISTLCIWDLCVWTVIVFIFYFSCKWMHWNLIPRDFSITFSKGNIWWIKWSKI